MRLPQIRHAGGSSTRVRLWRVSPPNLAVHIQSNRTVQLSICLVSAIEISPAQVSIEQVSIEQVSAPEMGTALG